MHIQRQRQIMIEVIVSQITVLMASMITVIQTNVIALAIGYWCIDMNIKCLFGKHVWKIIQVVPEYSEEVCVNCRMLSVVILPQNKRRKLGILV